jgi:predicted ATPase
MPAASNRYVITGGPGSGKSTLIEGLQKAGYPCSSEVSRRMIIAEVAKGSDCLPWADIRCFSVKVMDEMILAWNSGTAYPQLFFDRGMPDVIAYLKVASLEVPQDLLANLSAYPYHNQVFILPPWETIFVNDTERWQSFAEATDIHEAIRETYLENGYQLIEVPQAPVAERMAFILDQIK